MSKPLSALCFLLFFVGCTSDHTEAARSKVQLNFGKTTYSIPSEYFTTDLPTTMIPDEGLDSDTGISLKIPMADIELSPEALIDAKSGVLALLRESKDAQSQPSILPSGLAAWNGKGLFKDRVIEFDDSVELFRVYPESGYPVFWEFFRTSPLDSGTAEPTWVAGCWASDSSDALNNATCDFPAKHMGVYGRISFPGKYIEHAEEIKLGFIKLLRGWAQQP